MDSERQRLKIIKPNLELRADIYRHIREYFNERGFLEVETPIRIPVIAPELYIEPISSEDWYLLTSPELHMKRLLAAGYTRLFQICRCFRRGERGRLHNPEFTMLEWYRASGNYLDVIADTENLVIFLVKKLNLDYHLKYQDCEFDLSLPWQRMTVRDAFLHFAGWDPIACPDPLRFDIDFCEKVIPAFSKTSPTVIMDYPASMASLARLKLGDKEVAERAEVFFSDLEIANGYSELVDPEEQEKRFLREIEQIEKQYGRKMALPIKFLDSMKYMPECGGIALGVDRLVMLLCDASSIDEVMPFTVETL